MKDKPTKWGVKLWVLADSDNGYTVEFNVYIGKETQGISKHGLGYDVVMELVEPYLNQGYHLYLDNFYTSPGLLEHLFFISYSSYRHSEIEQDRNTTMYVKCAGVGQISQAWRHEMGQTCSCPKFAMDRQ